MQYQYISINDHMLPNLTKPGFNVHAVLQLRRTIGVRNQFQILMWYFIMLRKSCVKILD